MLSVNEASVGYENGPLFEKMNFNLNKGDRVGVVGPNGAGKSSLLNMINGGLAPEKGSVTTEASVGYLVQTPDFEEPVAAYIDRMSGNLISTNAELEELYPHMDDPDVLAKVGKLQEEFEQKDGWNTLARIEEILTKLDTPKDAMDKSFGEFSGGQQSRILLAGQLIQEPDVLLLDEPTNNLDQEGLEWLEEYLGDYKGAAVVVSHDREFLDNTATRIVEIDGFGGEPAYYDGNYSAYREEKAARAARHDQVLEAQRKKQNQIEDAVQAQRERSSNIHGASNNSYYRSKASKLDKGRKAMEGRLKRMQQDPTWLGERNERESLPLKLGGESQKGKRLLAATALQLGYGADASPIIENANFTIEGQDRVAIVGKNGTGKTTLLSAMAGREDIVQGGKIEAYTDFDILTQSKTQETAKASKNSMLEWFRNSVGSIYEEDAMSLLAWFGFDKHRFHKPVSNLSPGEISKLTLLGMTHSDKELLMLDEPTNHLDFDALDVTEDALKEFKGTLITVSHDRRFLGNIACNRIFEIKDRTVAVKDA